MRVTQRIALKFVCLETLWDNQNVKQMEHTSLKITFYEIVSR